jgi:transcriptional regulator with XRE-family HTH domain
MSDKALSETMGTFIRQHRLAQNRTQHEVAAQAGISRSTLSLLEKGETVTVPTLIQVLRVLELLHIMESFTFHEQISPLQLAKLEQEKRVRASSKKESNDKPESEW